MKHLLLYVPNDQFSYALLTALIFIILISIFAFFEAWKIHDQQKSLKSKTKQNERHN